MLPKLDVYRFFGLKKKCFTFYNKLLATSSKSCGGKRRLLRFSLSSGSYVVRRIYSPTMGLARKILTLRERKGVKGNRKITEWLQKNRLMSSTKKCRICKKKMKLRKTQNKDGYQW